jgi:acyl transferase domain-containing protein/D-arabinose 1-dehydrogenase-like Zn-dependent alcohol dehydrogenase/NADP-dependent 3-hydroxy acid dehydrogenase YdfG/acyl carrier protein
VTHPAGASTAERSALDQRLLERLLREKYEPIAIVGIGIRFPGGNDTPQGFADFLARGGSGITPIPPERWDVAALASSDTQPGRIRTSGGGFLNGIDQFDPRFFNIAPKEAQYIDPHHRLVLECAWRALEHAQIDPHSLKDSDGGVYVGIACVDYTIEVESLRYEELDGHIGTGTSHSSAAGRLSFFLGLRGPCIALDTACSSSLVAAHLAIQGLRRGECRIALAGGVNVVHHPRHHIIFSQAGMLAKDGRCKTFDAAADGYGRSEGAGMLVLKRLSDALHDGDPVIALLRGSAIAQDGAGAGLTVPNGPAQEMVMRRALDSAMLKPHDVPVVEAHGTGTPLGDPIEMGAIQAVFGAGRDASDPVIVSSVKTNLGHMEAAAGVGGIVKAALQVQQGVVYPHLNLQQPSPQIPWHRMAVRIPAERLAWPQADGPAVPRRVMVNSFGFSGIIAAVLVEQAPPAAAAAAAAAAAGIDEDIGPQLFTASARSRPALRTLLSQYRQRLAAADAPTLAAWCQAARLGRAHFGHRFAAVAPSSDALAAAIDVAVQAADTDDAAASRQSPRIAFLFTGQGAQVPGMGAGLYRRYAAFREAVDDCDSRFAALIGRSIRALMFGQTPDAAELLGQTAFTQAALFTFEFAGARLWRRFGIVPDALIGHSIGELAAAAVAGVFSLDDAVRVVAERGRLMQSVQQPGGMLAVSAPAERVMPLLQGLDDVSFAAMNAPSQCVVSGGSASLAVVAQALAEAGLNARPLAVSHAFHSPLMHEVFPAFREVFNGITLNEPAITLVSNVSGAIAREGELTDPGYWVRHIGEPVRFADGIRALAAQGRWLFIEVGPAPVLTGLARASLNTREHAWGTPLQTDPGGESAMLHALAETYRAGAAIDWAAAEGSRRRPLPDLPVHPFDRRRCWLPLAVRHARLGEAGGADGHPLLGQPATDAAAGTHHFVQRIAAHRPAYLADHVVAGATIFPAAGYVEVLLALQDALFGEHGRAITDFTIHEALVLRADGFTELHTDAQPRPDGGLDVRITSRLEGVDGGSRHHVSAVLAPVVYLPADPPAHDDFIAATIAARESATAAPVAIDRDAFYTAYERIGLSYGPSFRGVQAITRIGDVIAAATIASPAHGAELMPPALLDAALQSVAALIDGDATYLPVRIGRLRLLKKPRGPINVLVHHRTAPADGDDRWQADLVLREADGRVVLGLQGLVLKRVAAAAAPPPLRMVHERRWIKRSLVAAAATGARTVLMVNAPPPLRELASPHIELHFADDAAQAAEHLRASAQIADVAWFWPPALPATDVQAVRAECESRFSSLLALVHGLYRDFYERRIKLWIVTSAAQTLPGDAPSANVQAPPSAAAWGFGAVLQTEAPRLKPTLIDLPPDPAQARDALVEEWSAGDAGSADNRIAWRSGHRHVQRIVAPADRGPTNFRIASRELGLLANLRIEPAPDREPAPGEIEVELHAAGLNFKDVLNALGMLREHARAMGIEYTPLPLGFEGAGIVRRCGEGSGFEPGDRVMVNHAGCMQRRITVPAGAAARLPAKIDMLHGAGIPTAFVTAHYALHGLAKLQRGESVLIHAAAGGVGQAALQLARRAGARVFATASPRKWALLRAQGVEQVMNSRSLAFADELLQATGGRGVDVVLNSLNKDFIPASLATLAVGGRFVELGKVGVWSAQRMAAEWPDVRYFNFDLSEYEPQRLLAINREILDEVGAAIDAGELTALPCTGYGLDDIEEAFSVLSRGANVGKLVIRLQDEEPSPSTIQHIDTGVVLVTGAFGGLGEPVVQTLARRGARRLMLVGRQLPDTAAIDALRARLPQGVQVQAIAADVSTEADVQKLRAAIIEMAGRDAASAPLAGIVHAAGRIADAPIASLDAAAFDAVLAPKLYGGWLLQQMAASLPGQPFFVAFSSVAAVVGSAGQANYAAANAWLDELAAHRSAAGLPSLSLNWGPFADVGMAARLDAAQAQSVHDRGFRFIAPEQGMGTLAALLQAGARQAIVGEVDWQRVAQRQQSPLYALVAPAGAAADDESWSPDDLMRLPRDERAAKVNRLVRTSIAEMLHFGNADDIEADAPFAELGLDSLVGLELMNGLEAALGVPLPNSAVLDAPTLPLMTDFILDQLDKRAASAASNAA